MDIRSSLAALFVATALLASGTALAQDNTGADRPTTAPATESSGAKSNGVYPAPTQGVEQGVPAGRAAQPTLTTHSSKHKPHQAKKPANSAITAPGPVGGRDAKEQ